MPVGRERRHMIGYEVMDGLSMEEQVHGKISFFDKEQQLARNFVLKANKDDAKKAPCVLCGAKRVKRFCDKWGVRYLLCRECWTIFAPAASDVVRAFACASPLADLRRSAEYQRSATENRMEIWKNLVQWLEHRIFRHLGKPHDNIALCRSIRYLGLLEKLRESGIFSRVDVKGSIVAPDDFTHAGYDVVLYLDTVQQRVSPMSYLTQAADFLKPSGLLFLNTRVGSGFDILTLKGKIESVFPYEHVFLPSVRALYLMLEKAGFSVLEASTPGMFDVAHLYKQRELIGKGNLFAQFLTSEYDERIFMDFQKFLQKHGFSSTVRIIARRI